MLPSPIPSERTYRHVVEQPTLRRVVEHFTLFTLLFAVSLYAIGQFETWKYISSFGIPTTGLDHAWETHVFTGAVAVINLLLNLGWSSLRWILPALLFLGFWMARRRAARSEEGFIRRVLLPLLTTGVGAAYIFFLMMVGIAWGIESAKALKTYPAPPQRYIVTPEAQANLPKAFQEANAKGALRYVATGADVLFVYDPTTQQTFAVPTRLIVCRIFEPQAPR